MVTLTFIRHGPTQENHDGRIQGQQPGRLLVRETEAYLSAITPMLRQKKPSVLVSSDLKRATATRHILKEFLQLPDVREVTLPLLRERSVGSFEGKLWTDLPEALRGQRGQSNYNFKVCGGEDHHDVARRVGSALQYFASAHAGERVCCISHACWLQQVTRLVSHESVPDDWFDRTAIYEARVSPASKIVSFSIQHIAARLPQDLG